MVVLGFAGTQVGGTLLLGVYDVVGFACTAPASAGNFSVPSSALQGLPQVSGDVTSGQIGSLAVYTIPDPSRGQGVFTAPLTAGGNVDFSVFSYTVGTLRLAGYN